ncbi:hypothetical protein AAFF_G00421010 [Aldrovandia affinis]|uniref:G-protein coupled receptors family 1 profile domain-containing protein n=1 Tax=Aldrovandia affinis TaxID=143900 RepID=A0AAD7S9Z2_9TELE|nr:hypothetical protein AAFF_G00421010 [Aldrovandia affinis]
MQQFNSSVSNSTSWNAERVAPSVVLGLCCLMGVPSNIAVIMVIVRNYKREKFTLKLMLNLAVSDLLSLLAVPVSIYALLHGWSFGGILCKLFSYIFHCSLYSAVLTVTLMSVQLYVQVLYRKHWKRQHRKGERVLLVSLWVLACLLASANIPTQDIIDKRNLQRCQRITRSDSEKVLVLLLETLLGFVVPFSILVTSYLCFHKKLKQTFFSRTRMTEDKAAKFRRITKLVISIVVTFFIFWFPAHVINVLDISTTLLKESQPAVYEKLKTFRRASGDIAKTLTLINSCLNPFLYAFIYRRKKEQKRHHNAQRQQKDSELCNI